MSQAVPTRVIWQGVFSGFIIKEFKSSFFLPVASLLILHRVYRKLEEWSIDAFKQIRYFFMISYNEKGKSAKTKAAWCLWTSHNAFVPLKLFLLMVFNKMRLHFSLQGTSLQRATSLVALKQLILAELALSRSVTDLQGLLVVQIS